MEILNDDLKMIELYKSKIEGKKYEIKDSSGDWGPMEENESFLANREYRKAEEPIVIYVPMHNGELYFGWAGRSRDYVEKNFRKSICETFEIKKFVEEVD